MEKVNSLKGLTDEQVLAGIRMKDYDTFTSLYASYFHNLSMVSMKYVSDIFIAEEIVQDIFIKIWENPELSDQIFSLRSYLYKAVINQSINYLNRQKNIELHHLRIAGETQEQYIDTLHEEQELKRIIYNEIERLPVQCRRVFKMSRFEGLKYREIASRLDLSEKTVENHIANALKLLRSRLLVSSAAKNSEYRLKLMSVLFCI